MQAKHEDDGYRKEFEDTTGGTSGVDMEGSSVKEPKEDSEQPKDDYIENDYEDDYQQDITQDQQNVTEDQNLGLQLGE